MRYFRGLPNRSPVLGGLLQCIYLRKTTLSFSTVYCQIQLRMSGGGLKIEDGCWTGIEAMSLDELLDEECMQLREDHPLRTQEQVLN